MKLGLCGNCEISIFFHPILLFKVLNGIVRHFFFAFAFAFDIRLGFQQFFIYGLYNNVQREREIVERKQGR